MSEADTRAALVRDAQAAGEANRALVRELHGAQDRVKRLEDLQDALMADLEAADELDVWRMRDLEAHRAIIRALMRRIADLEWALPAPAPAEPFDPYGYVSGDPFTAFGKYWRLA